MHVLKSRKAWCSFLLPGLLAYILTVFFPILQSIYYSLINWNGVSDPSFVGLKNYQDMFKDSIFWKSFFNNLEYIALVVAIQMLLGLFIAVMLTAMKRGTNLIRTLYYIPAIITTVGIAQLLRFMFSMEPLGLVNALLMAIGLGDITQSWLSNPNTSLAFLSFGEGWRFVGMYIIIFYSGLQSIDSEVIEAAKIDGAGSWKCLIYVRLPLLVPIIQLALILSLTTALKGFDIPYLINGPSYSTELVTTYMYKKAFVATRFGYGSAIACFVVMEAFIAVGAIKLIFRRRRGME